MPAQPTWFHRLDEILDELKSLPAPFLDRHAVGKLFRVGERRSRQLMSDLPAIRIGNSIAVERFALIRKLEGVAVSDGCTSERSRKQRIGEHLDQLRKHLAARRVCLSVVADVHGRRLDGLTGGIELKPGELRILFSGADDLAAQLFELSQAMANDWHAFSKAVESR